MIGVWLLGVFAVFTAVDLWMRHLEKVKTPVWWIETDTNGVRTFHGDLPPWEELSEEERAKAGEIWYR